MGLIVGLSVASGPYVLLLVLGALLITRDFKQRKAKALRQKFFNQNRGQLLKQLVSHRADIAERMLISLDELEKATNNFDQVRRLGGGGHGTLSTKEFCQICMLWPSRNQISWSRKKLMSS